VFSLEGDDRGVGAAAKIPVERPPIKRAVLQRLLNPLYFTAMRAEVIDGHLLLRASGTLSTSTTESNVFGDARKSHVLIDLTSRNSVDIVKLRFTNLNEIPVQHSNH
jgi:hypothetical protein